ncbi:MAG: RluA family pseudouridine synthase [Haliangiales bacterium]
MSTRSRNIRIEISDADAGKRLDQVLAAHIPELSRRRARVLLDIGGVFVDRARVKVAGRKLRRGQIVEAHIGGALSRATNEVGRAARARDDETLPDYAIVHEDEDIVVVEKPAGLLTAPTPESDRGNLAALLAERGAAGDTDSSPISVVHRIDLETSGLLVFAKTSAANRALAARFRAHDVERAYRAVVVGAAEGCTVTVPIQGRRAVTHFRVVEVIAPSAAAEAEGKGAAEGSALQRARAESPTGGALVTVLEARLETGRTHQIRLHCRHLGHLVVGDPQYRLPGQRSAVSPKPPRMALHACVLGFAHPRTGERLRFESPLPEDLASWLAALRVAVQQRA